MRPPKSAARPPASLTSPKTGANKRQRKAASAVPLGDITNLLVLAESPTPSKPRRTARRALPATSDVSAVSSTCSSSASVTPAPKPSSAAGEWSYGTALALCARFAATGCGRMVVACLRPHWAGISNPGTSSSFAVFEEERSVVKSPTISTVHRRTTGAQERWRRNPASANNKGKEPVAATASCPPLGKSARTHSRWDYFTCLVPVHVICVGVCSIQSHQCWCLSLWGCTVDCDWELVSLVVGSFVGDTDLPLASANYHYRCL